MEVFFLSHIVIIDDCHMNMAHSCLICYNCRVGTEIKISYLLSTDPIKYILKFAPFPSPLYAPYYTLRGDKNSSQATGGGSDKTNDFSSTVNSLFIFTLLDNLSHQPMMFSIK